MEWSFFKNFDIFGEIKMKEEERWVHMWRERKNQSISNEKKKNIF